MPYYLLAAPAAAGVVAIATDWLPAKLAVPGLCAVVIYFFLIRGARRVPDLWWVIVAFVFSMVGDAFLSSRGDSDELFVLGIAGFFVAHIGYLGFAVSNGHVHKGVLMLLYAAYLPFYVGWLAPAIDDPVLSGAVLIYLLISCLVLGAAAGLNLAQTPKAMFTAGIASIVVSDTFIAFKEFLGWAAFDPWILPTYYLAHLLITAALIARAGHYARFRPA